mmetsp:Transcript_43326/g.72045  ORF Transcript_43326/g.72045 Transcript_43326/m.72045 type:complete len:85 (+) Transcript_43326:399-653(+)
MSATAGPDDDERDLPVRTTMIPTAGHRAASRMLFDDIRTRTPPPLFARHPWLDLTIILCMPMSMSKSNVYKEEVRLFADPPSWL